MAYAALWKLPVLLFIIVIIITAITCTENNILGCEGFVKSHVKIDYSEIEIGLYTKEGSLKEKTECAPTNGYYFLPLYEKGEYVLKVHPPAGLSFEPSEVVLSIDGVTDMCSTGQDINFAFNGYGINGKVVTLGQKQGPSGIAVQLVNDKGETRDTVTTVGGDFHFSAVIPGKYTVKASHPRWKLEPSQVEVQMKEGKMALPLGVVLAVKGYDVKGSVTSFGGPIENLYVLLYSKEDNQKYRVEGCNTALLQGVPDSPICHVTTNAQGEFTFGLVPAGEYRLLALPTTPGQVEVSYNVKPDSVPFTVRHDSLYIKNAFEVIGFTVVGSVISAPGKGLPGARVLLDGTAVGVSDATGKFTLPGLQPGVYTVSFEHERCKIEDIEVSVGSSGPRGAVVGRASLWRVCGNVTPVAARHVALRPERASANTILVNIQDTGKWCTYLPPGTYTASVEVTEQEQRGGLQFYPLSQKVSVGHAPVEGVQFSQLKGRLSGTVECGVGACKGVTVTLRPLSPDGGYVGAPVDTVVVDGKYSFSEVLPGSVEVTVSSDTLCWARRRHTLSVTQAETAVPPFAHSGYLLHLHTTHSVEVEYKSKSSSGVFKIPRGASQQCVPRAELYSLTPRGCHMFDPTQATVDTAADKPTTVHFIAIAHAVGVKVTSPDSVDDLVLVIDKDGNTERIGPLAPTQDGGMFVFEHTIYMAEGDVVVISATSQSLLFHPGNPTQVVGGSECQPAALVLRARRALTLQGRLVPPVDDVTLTLSTDEGVVVTLTSSDGTYRFGPLDAAHVYTVRAEKESYVFGAPDERGDITAHKLAEIIVELVDDADGKPLQGALVSVSGGAYRRSALQAGAALKFPSLSPADYYVKPNMKEYKFTPPHALLAVQEGKTHTLTLKGVRVAWSCMGALVSLGGAGWAGATLAAVPSAGPPHCAVEEATTEPTGAFRIRGLLPDCEYNIHLKEPASPELAGLRLARKPQTLKIVDKRDITDVTLIGVQPASVTDANVLVRTDNIEHYRTLRLTLAPQHGAPIYSTRLLPAGYSQHLNPGLMYVLPRLPADNKTYVVALESSLSKATHTYEDEAHTFTSDGKFKYFHFQFEPKVKSSEQELRQSSFLLIPLLGVVALVYSMRERIAAALPRARAARPPRPAARPDVLDHASIHHILNTVNPPAKKQNKTRKAM